MNKAENLAKITLHGEIGEILGKKEWNLSVERVGEAFHAINILSKRKLFPYLLESEERNTKFSILVNNKEIDGSKIEPSIESIANSELNIKRKIKTIDIVPVIEGAMPVFAIGLIFQAISGVIAIVSTIAGAIASGIGAAAAAAAGSSFWASAAITLIAGGLAYLLAKPPKFDDFREIENTRKNVSYLFNGPANSVNEGGPVPIGYGRLIVGSQVISTSINISQKTVEEIGSTRTG